MMPGTKCLAHIGKPSAMRMDRTPLRSRPCGSFVGIHHNGERITVDDNRRYTALYNRALSQTRDVSGHSQ